MHLRALTAVLLLTACNPKPADTDADTGSSAAETDGASVTSATDTTPVTSTGPTTDPTTGPTPPTTVTTGPDDPTTAGPTPSTTASDTSAETATDSGDTSSEGGLPGACSDVCQHWHMCEPGSVGPPEVCKAGCLEGVEVPSECAMAMAAQWSCVAGLPCDEALKFLQGEAISCLEELEVANELCGGEGCAGEVGGGEIDCTLMQECGQGQQEYKCEGETCTCKQDGVIEKECPSDGFCMLGGEEQRAAITACCGWDWK